MQCFGLWVHEGEHLCCTIHTQALVEAQ